MILNTTHLQGELTPILVQMVKSANTNGLLDNDCDSSKYHSLTRSVIEPTESNSVLLGGAAKGKTKKGKIVSEEYYESYYRNLDENSNLRDLKDRSMVLVVFAATTII